MSVDAPIQQSDNLFVGEDKTLNFTIVDAAGVAQDITGWSLEWVLRKTADTRSALVTKTDGSGITITSGVGGLCSVVLTDADTVKLAPGTYFHSLRRSDAGAEVVLSFGDVTLRRAATR